jgi:hypothetical protein
VDYSVEDFFERWLSCLVGDIDEDEEKGDQSTDWKIDIETW